MNDKNLIGEVYKALSLNPSIQTLLETDGSPKTMNNRISRTKQITNVADGLTRLAIWEDTPKPATNFRVWQHSLVISIFCTTEKQNSNGLSFDILDQVEKVINTLEQDLRESDHPIGMGINRVIKQSNLRTSYGWFKSEVRFEYNSID